MLDRVIEIADPVCTDSPIGDWKRAGTLVFSSEKQVARKKAEFSVSTSEPHRTSGRWSRDLTISIVPNSQLI
jgi:hypothetical protein